MDWVTAGAGEAAAGGPGDVVGEGGFVVQAARTEIKHKTAKFRAGKVPFMQFPYLNLCPPVARRALPKKAPPCTSPDRANDRRDQSRDVMVLSVKICSDYSQ